MLASKVQDVAGASRHYALAAGMLIARLTSVAISGSTVPLQGHVYELYFFNRCSIMMKPLREATDLRRNVKHTLFLFRAR